VRQRARIIASLLVALLCGCGEVQRTVSIDSQPQGALVYANNQEIGRTPLQRDFVWYGTYDVAASMDGYQTTHKPLKVIAPWWQWPPIDLLVEILPIHAKDVRHYTLTLQSASTQPVDPEQMLSRAEQMRLQLQGSKYTRNPATMPATTAATTNSSAFSSTPGGEIRSPLPLPSAR
jgi:hypothetical protein